MHPPQDDPATVHGLQYPPSFLDALPVLRPRPEPHPPIRALTVDQFSDLHLSYLTTHAPDHVLFPFLHGLEGDNEAQNSFFACARPRGDVPRFRGLVWVACDEDEDDLCDVDDLDDDDDDYSTTSSLDSFGPTDLEEDVAMQLDPTVEGPMMNGCPPPEPLDKLPVGPPPIPLTAGHLPPSSHAHTKPSMLTSSFRARDLLRTRTESDGAPVNVFVEPKIPDGISLRNFGIQVVRKLRTLRGPSGEVAARVSRMPDSPPASESVLQITRVPPRAALVCAYCDASRSPRPLVLVHAVFCFTSRIGMSRAPIYATLSDIVVYSPRGVTRSAIAIAEKFKQAVEIKYQERRARCPSPDALVPYNVFVLDASASELAEKVPHLVVRTENAFRSGAHTDSTDAHAHGDEFDDSAHPHRANTIDFAQREKDEMRDLTQASEIVSVADPASHIDLDALAGSNTATHWEPAAGQIFLGNSNDVPLPPDRRIRMRTVRGDDDDDDAFDWRTNDPSQGYGYDLCIECHDYAPFPTSAHLRAAEEHMRILEKRWIERCVSDMDNAGSKDALPPRPPPNASHVVHLPFPSSPASSVVTVNTLLPFIQFLERLIQPVDGSLTFEAAREHLHPPRPQNAFETPNRHNSVSFTPSSLPPPSSFPTSFFPSPSSPQSAYTRVRSTSATFLPASSPGTPVSTSPTSGPPAPLRTRPAKILIYSADGYTESSVLALCILMALRATSLPEAYLALQVEKRRSFFVYQSDLGVLRRVEARLEKDRAAHGHGHGQSHGQSQIQMQNATHKHPSPLQGDGSVWSRSLGHASGRSVTFANPPVVKSNGDSTSDSNGNGTNNGETALGDVPTGVSAPASANPLRTRSESNADAPLVSVPMHVMPGRPRAQTMPPGRVPPWRDHQVWFNDPRFDGSFPSRVLPFLYLGNLNHASNAFMLHALGITHVVSVGECALVPPPHLENGTAATGPTGPTCTLPSPGAQFVPGKGPGGQGSLWIEEREGRIKVLDIKGVCDDGIDTLEPQLEPICEWIDRAREEGGKVLVHCRVGVSRSATVTIAYVMKHLGLPLVDAYLIVRSRRLSVLIQPNMRLLYNLLGWEIRLARERAERALARDGVEDAGEREARMKRRMRNELARALNWPYLAKEVHALNEKYLH
ncbi:hypothetical protein K466DRAFT_502359 [Polyporus arcularius HHB13444]|uniref:Uncharacterized protein n=1 Tax=Polyporus arcularius HHB13444 TaxID=1314778 RepID=A0A5C3NVG6_9APHY|nr:hypothetical protein K466DRAFT_502359 [Polyporus arcularius HHB13444]